MSRTSHSVSRRVQFVLERWVQRGLTQQLLLMAGLVAAVAVLGGVAAWTSTSAFESLPVAIWWSFLRLTDPGYLGDDEGAVLRVVSTVVTVLGYVLFMGSLIAIMTQWLAKVVRKLESGLTPIAMQNHFVILGWTNRTAEIIKKLLSAGGRLERFFAQRSGHGRLRIVVLAEEVDAQRRLELRENLGADWSEGQVFLRSGSSLQREHLERLDLRRAAVVIVPGADFELGGAQLTDARVVKTLLTLDALLATGRGNSEPHVVAEMFDPRKVSMARECVGARSEIIAGDRLLSRMLSQSMRHLGVASVLLQLLTHREGSALYLRDLPELVGRSLRSLIGVFPQAVALGVVSTRNGELSVHLDPARDVELQEGDQLILLAERYENAVPGKLDGPQVPLPRQGSLPRLAQPARRRLLILGWSYKISALLAELLESGGASFEVTILSLIPTQERERALQHLNLASQLVVHHAEGDYSIEHDLRQVEPADFDHVLFLASGRMDSSEEADARTVLGLLLLRSILRGRESAPEVLVELLDPANASILGETAESVFVSPRMLSHLLAHVGLLPDLNAVFDELICTGGAEIELRPLGDLGLGGARVTFEEVQLAAAGLGSVALGFYAASEASGPHQVHLNPERERSWSMNEGDRIILLSSEDDDPAGPATGG